MNAPGKAKPVSMPEMGGSSDAIIDQIGEENKEFIISENEEKES